MHRVPRPKSNMRRDSGHLLEVCRSGEVIIGVLESAFQLLNAGDTTLLLKESSKYASTDGNESFEVQNYNCQNQTQRRPAHFG